MGMSARISVSRHKALVIRLYHPSFPNGESWEGTKWKDTLANRKEAEAFAEKITAEMKAGTFDYLRHFPAGNRAKLFAQQNSKMVPQTIRQRYDATKKDKMPPFVRRSYWLKWQSHFTYHILSMHGDRLLNTYTVADIRELRAALIEGREGREPVQMRTARNVINSSLRAMFRDAQAEGLVEKNPFLSLPPKWWPPGPREQPDPFTEEERDEILAYFDKKYRQTWARGSAFMFSLFWTGARPSELTARRFSDYDQRSGSLTISSSRTEGEDGETKTSKSNRTIKLFPPVMERFEEIRPLRAGPDDYIFTTKKGEPIGQAVFAQSYFWPALTALKIRHRPFYNTRHTWISVMLLHGEHPKAIADYAGNSPAVIYENYARWLGDTSKFGEAALNAVVTKKEASHG